nr:hypothetical protein [Rickettsia endosymbiont of Ceutorhynchus assimilis]
MTIAKEVVYALHQRLKDLSVNATPDQLAYLAKSLESIAGQSTVLDIVQMTDEKLKELLNAATKHLSDLDTRKASFLAAVSESEKQLLKRIDEKGTTNLSLLDSRKDSHVATINNAGDLNSIRNTLSSLKAISDIPTGSSIMKEIKTREDQLTNKFNSINDIPSGSSIIKEIKKRNMVEPGSLPFLFSVLNRNNDHNWGNGHFTTELGKWYSDTSYTNNMLCLLTGAHSYDISYVGFYRPPSLYFMQGKNGTFIYRELYSRYQCSSYEYSYPYALLGVIFVKNTTNSEITRTLNFVGTSYWSSQYEGAGAFVGTPDNTNKGQVASISWKNIYNLGSSNSGFSSSGVVIVPANKTVAILFYTSPYYYTSSNNYYTQFMQWRVYNFRSNFLTTGLEVDVERTLKAWQCPGLERTDQIWQ